MRFIRPKAGILALCLAAVTCCNTALAQVTYRLHRVPLMLGSGSSVLNTNGMNNLGLAVGSHEPGGVKQGFVYDHYGLVGLPKTTHTLTEWVAVPPGWNSSCVGLNDMGQVVGLFERTTALGTERVGFLLDLDIFSVTPTPSWRFLPTVPGALSSYGRRINNHGLVLIEEQLSIDRQFVYDSSDPNAELVPIPGYYDLGRFSAINDSRQLVTGNNSVSNSIGVRLTLTPDLVSQQELILIQEPNVYSCNCINESGDLGLTLREIRDSRKQIITPRLAARYSDDLGLVKLSTIESGVFDINDSGDVCGYHGTPNSPAIYTDEDGWLSLKERVAGEPNDVEMWLAAQTYHVRYISNRDATGFGNVYAVAIRSTTTGKGKKAVTTQEIRHFLLVPELP